MADAAIHKKYCRATATVLANKKISGKLELKSKLKNQMTSLINFAIFPSFPLNRGGHFKRSFLSFFKLLLNVLLSSSNEN